MKTEYNYTKEELQEMDFSKFEGKVIKWIDPEGIKASGIVTGMDFNIGLSVEATQETIDKYDCGRYLTCLNGPTSPNEKSFDSEQHYIQIFNICIEMLNGEVFDARKLYNNIEEEYYKYLPMAECAFSA